MQIKIIAEEFCDSSMVEVMGSIPLEDMYSSPVSPIYFEKLTRTFEINISIILRTIVDPRRSYGPN